MSEALPKGWKFVPLSNLARVVSGGTPSRDVNSYWGGDIPWVTPTDITRTNGRYLVETQESITKFGLSASSATLLPPGSILMTSRATIGESRISGTEVCTNQGFKSLVPQNGANGLFLYYQMQRLRGAYKVFGIGSTFLEVSKKDTERFSVLMPADEGEQKSIAAVIDSVDGAIEKTEAIITKYQQIKAGMMHDLFTRGVTTDGKLRPPREQAPEFYQETPIGWMPKEWVCSSVESLLERIIDYRGKTPTKSEDGIPLITAKNVRMGYIDPEPREFIATRDYSAWMTRGIPVQSDVVFTTEAPLGNVAQIGTNERVAFAQRVIILQPGFRVFPNFLRFLLMTESFQRSALRLSSGSTALGIKQSEFRKIMVWHPVRLEEQQLIADKLIALEDFEATEADMEGKLRAQKFALMSDLLTGKVRVPV